MQVTIEDLPQENPPTVIRSRPVATGSELSSLYPLTVFGMFLGVAAIGTLAALACERFFSGYADLLLQLSRG